MMRAATLAVLLVMGGCLEPQTGSNGSTGTGGPPASCAAQEPPLVPDGEALAPESITSWAQQVVELPDGSLRPRVPSQDGHPCTADWLEQAIDAPGWDVVRSDFTGQEYLELPKGRVAAYEDACGPEDAREVEAMQLTNLAAVWDGPGNRTVLLAAHWDAKEDHNEGGGPVPAANDGASGVAVLLALQRHIVQNDIAFPFDVAVALFDAEDGFEDCHPLAGSIHFAHTMPIDVDRLILLDMVGDEEARFPREAQSVDSDPALVELIWSLADDHGLGQNFVDTVRPVSDDHVPFIEQGVPSVDIIDFARPAGEGRSGFPPYWHTPDDTLDKLSGDMMARIAGLLLDVLHDERFTAEWPAKT